MSIQNERDFENIRENFKENSKELSEISEMRIGALDDTLNLLFEPDLLSSELELIEIYRSKLTDTFKLDGADVNIAHLDAYSRSVGIADLIALSRMILEKSNESYRTFSSLALLEPEPAQQFSGDIRIAYRKAHGADIAFEKFASLIVDAVAIYRDNFASVCDSVALCEADMCILPYENTEDGKLSGFYRLIDSYELKIAASCLVCSSNRTDKTRYLLLSKSLAGLSGIAGITDFEFSLKDRNNMTVTRALSAANLLGIEILSIDTVKSDGDLKVFDIRVTCDSAALDAFILYLKLDKLEFTPLGLYAVID